MITNKEKISSFEEKNDILGYDVQNFNAEMSEFQLRRDWEDIIASKYKYSNFESLVSLKKNPRLERTYRQISCGSKGLSSPGSWTSPAIRAAFSPFQNVIVAMTHFGVDWKEVYEDLEEIGVAFRDIFFGNEQLVSAFTASRFSSSQNAESSEEPQTSSFEEGSAIPKTPEPPIPGPPRLREQRAESPIAESPARETPVRDSLVRDSLVRESPIQKKSSGIFEKVKFGDYTFAIIRIGNKDYARRIIINGVLHEIKDPEFEGALSFLGMNINLPAEYSYLDQHLGCFEN